MPPTHLSIEGLQLPLHRFRALVVGSGAAGLNCAEHLHELGVSDLAVVTAQLGGGTSANSGSDRQTYYKMGVFGDAPDSPMELARSLTAGGMCHGDLAYIEALGSLPEFFHLVRNGVAFPHNRYGAYVGYKTDHDPRRRGTSAGPKTSMQMVERSLARVRANGTPFFDGFEAVRLLVAGGRAVFPLSGTERGPGGEAAVPRVVGLLALDRSSLGEPGFGLTVFLAESVVLATGGPGELYRDSVYPPGQVGSHGLALEVGCRANNLTESQFGLASGGFRWNLSGTYQQVIPCYFSTDASGGDVRFFLSDVFPTMRQEATCIFLKGYQWPFHAERLQDFGSSLVDLAVHEELRAGRRVHLDFSRNPVASEGLEEFSLDDLEPEARRYLENSGALQATPYERLRQMNPLAIEVYAEHGVDLREPLPVAVCAQHCNGGLTVDGWWRTRLPGLFAIGELAGTHGVRPGGSALNAGQVGGLRAAQWIAHEAGAPVGARLVAPDVREEEGGRDKSRPYGNPVREIEGQIAALIAELRRALAGPPGAPGVEEVRREIQERMTGQAGFIRSLAGAREALAGARAQWARLAARGQRAQGPEQLAGVIQNRHLCLTQLAFLTALEALLERGGGSRGGYVVLDEAGERQVTTRRGCGMRHRAENLALRAEILEVEPAGPGEFRVLVTPVRPLPQDESWYETTWREWREGRVFGDAGS